MHDPTPAPEPAPEPAPRIGTALPVGTRVRVRAADAPRYGESGQITSVMFSGTALPMHIVDLDCGEVYAYSAAELDSDEDQVVEDLFTLDAGAIAVPQVAPEQGARCSCCGLMHDVAGRITGDVIWCPCGYYLTVQHTARAFPPAPFDVPLEELGSLHLVSLRLGLSLGPQGERERALTARVDAELARRAPQPGADDATDEEPFGDVADETPVTARPFPAVAARPFSQLARRSLRLGLDVARGYVPCLSAAPYYHQRRRRSALRTRRTRARLLMGLRCERRRARFTAVRTRLPPVFYERVWAVA